MPGCTFFVGALTLSLLTLSLLITNWLKLKNQTVRQLSAAQQLSNELVTLLGSVHTIKSLYHPRFHSASQRGNVMALGAAACCVRMVLWEELRVAPPGGS